MLDLSSYVPETKPFAHQGELFANTAHLPAYGLLWEQGTGKTKPTIDTAAALYEAGEIDAVVVVAPNGVERNWKTDELPTHLPKRLYPKMKVEVYQSPKAGTKWHAAAMDALVKHKGFSWLLIGYDAFMTEKGKKFVWKFLRQRRVLYILDECHNIRTPKAKRTRSIVASGKYAPYRRILTGTPGDKPFDLYTQIKFIDETFWIRELSIHTAAEFRQYFGVWFTRAQAQAELGFDPGYDRLIEYKNLDVLERLLKKVTHRVTKDEVLDLPPKLYTKRYFDLNKECRDAYDQLKSDYIAEFEDGATIDGGLAIVRLLRLQQITCGYAYTDAEEPFRLLGKSNPRLGLVEDLRDSLHHPCIIWARFKKDIEQIMDVLGSEAVKYDGSLSDDEAERSKLAFQRGDAKWFVGNPQKGSSGLTLVQARTVAYYSNSYKMIERAQSEDRAHRIGQEHPVDYIDFCANNTCDWGIIQNLRGKFDIASQMTGDKLREWL